MKRLVSWRHNHLSPCLKKKFTYWLLMIRPSCLGFTFEFPALIKGEATLIHANLRFQLLNSKNGWWIVWIRGVITPAMQTKMCPRLLIHCWWSGLVLQPGSVNLPRVDIRVLRLWSRVKRMSFRLASSLFHSLLLMIRGTILSQGDSELDAIRQRRMQELMAQRGGGAAVSHFFVL